MEDMVNAERYMETRCPAWCDRVIFNADFKKDIAEIDLNIEYGTSISIPIGSNPKCSLTQIQPRL